MNDNYIAKIIVAIIGMFILPFAIMYSATELFNLNWEDKYWAVFCAIIIFNYLSREV